MEANDYLFKLKKLQTHFMQEYVESVFKVSFCEEWQKIAISVCKNLYKYRKTELISANNEISFSEENEFSFSKLDFTSLKAIAIMDSNKSPELKNAMKKYNITSQLFSAKTKAYIKNLTDDRDFESHLTYNEDYSELKEHIYGSINNLENLFKSIIETSDNETYIMISREYRKELEKIRLEFAEYDSSISAIYYDIKRIKDNESTYNDLFISYLHCVKDNPTRYLIFNELSSDMNIPYAIYNYAKAYYSGFSIKKDIEKSYKILVDKIEYLDNYGNALLATIYSNKNFCGYSEEKAKEIINKIGLEKIKTSIDRDGNTVYSAKY